MYICISDVVIILQELQEEFARVLTIHNTRIPDSLVEWSWKLREFVRLPPPPHLVTLLNVTGTILHKDSEEARIQLAGGVIGSALSLSLASLMHSNNIINVICSKISFKIQLHTIHCHIIRS